MIHKMKYYRASSGRMVKLVISDKPFANDIVSDGKNRVVCESVFDAYEALRSNESYSLFCANSIDRMLTTMNDRAAIVCVSCVSQ